MNKLALMVLEDQQIYEGMDLGVTGYENLKKDGKVLYGSAWIDVTRETMHAYNY